jgi:hypothetical protein
MRRWAWLWLPVAFFLLCAGWALTSPAGSAPDDDYHLASIWCAAGVEAGRCEEVPGQPLLRAVPADVVGASDCYRFRDEITAACTRTAVHGTPGAMTTTDRVNATAGLYPGLFYRAMAVMVGPDVEHSVLMMRLANAALAALLLALLMRIVPSGVRSATLVALVVTFVPLGIFVVASTNPSGWSVVGLLLLWAFSLSLLGRGDWRNRRTWLLAAAAVVAALMAIGSRVDSAAYAALTVLVVVVLAGPRAARRAPAAATVVGLIGVLGLVAYLLHGTPGSTGEATMGGADRGLGLLLTNAVHLPVLLEGAVGGWALGWNDTPLPPLVAFAGVLAMGAVAYRGLTAMTTRKAWAAGIAGAALVVVPLVFLQKEGLGVGEVVQPRYLLPMMALLLATLSVGARTGRPLPFPSVPAAVLATGLLASAVLAYWANAHRYFAGSQVALFDPKVQPAWASATGIPLWLTTLVTVAATVVFVPGVFVIVSRSAAGRSR